MESTPITERSFRRLRFLFAINFTGFEISDRIHDQWRIAMNPAPWSGETPWEFLIWLRVDDKGPHVHIRMLRPMRKWWPIIQLREEEGDLFAEIFKSCEMMKSLTDD